MKLKHLQATVAVVLLRGSILLGNVMSYATIGKVVEAGKVKQAESDTAAQRGRVKKPIGEVYMPRETKIEKNEIKAEAKLQETVVALQNNAVKAIEADKVKTVQKSTAPALNQGDSRAVWENGSAAQTPLAPAKSKDSTVTTAAVTGNTAVASEQKKIDVTALSYDMSRFTLSTDVRSLIVVEGFTAEDGKDTYYKTKVSDESRWNKARVAVFIRDEAGQWQAKVQSAGIYGYGGMPATWHSGDSTTPIGLWKTGTPFGRSTSEEGLPSSCTHIQVEAKRQCWSDRTNYLESAVKATEQEGEKLWEDQAKNIYAYALNTGFNKGNRRSGMGSALSLYCTSSGKPSTAGRVVIQPETMKAMFRQYAKGNMYTAQASEGQLKQVYGAFNESGTTVKSEFKVSTEGLPATEAAVLQ